LFLLLWYYSLTQVLIASTMYFHLLLHIGILVLCVQHSLRIPNTKFCKGMSSSAPTPKSEHQNAFVWQLVQNLYNTGGPTSSYTVAGTDFEFNYAHELSHLTELCLQQGGNTNHRASFRFTLTVFMGVKEIHKKQEQTFPVPAVQWVSSLCDMLSVCGFCYHSESLQPNWVVVASNSPSSAPQQPAQSSKIIPYLVWQFLWYI